MYPKEKLLDEASSPPPIQHNTLVASAKGRVGPPAVHSSWHTNQNRLLVPISEEHAMGDVVPASLDLDIEPPQL